MPLFACRDVLKNNNSNDENHIACMDKSIENEIIAFEIRHKTWNDNNNNNSGS